jgi:hypothetical protein
MEAVSIMDAALLAKTHVSNLYKQREKLQAFKHEGVWRVPKDALQGYIEDRQGRAKQVLAASPVSSGRRVFKRRIEAIPFGELLSHTGFFVQVNSYTLLEPKIGTAIAELELTFDIDYNADPNDRRGASLQINGCLLQQRGDHFAITLPEGVLSFPYPEEHAQFEFSVFRDLCKGFSKMVPTELVQVTERLRKEEVERLNSD